MKRLLLPLLALAAGSVSATSVKDPYDRNDGERLPNANDRLEAKVFSIPSAAEVVQFRFWEGSQYLREAARTEGIYRHPVSQTEGEAVLALLGKTEDWTLFGTENYLMPVREIDMVLTNGIVRTFRFWGHSGLIVLSDDRVFFADFHLPAPVFSAIAERMTAWRVDVVEAEKTWYRNLPLPREYRAHDGPDNGTLSGIAALFYGNGSKWRIIWEANKTVLPDPNIVRPGLKLTIPALNTAPATNAPALPVSTAATFAPAETNGFVRFALDFEVRAVDNRGIPVPSSVRLPEPVAAAADRLLEDDPETFYRAYGVCLAKYNRFYMRWCRQSYSLLDPPDVKPEEPVSEEGVPLLHERFLQPFLRRTGIRIGRDDGLPSNLVEIWVHRMAFAASANDPYGLLRDWIPPGDPATNESNALAARISIVPATAADPERSAVATTNGWSEIQNVIGDFFGGVEYVALETRAFTDGIVVARSDLEKKAGERRLRCEERFLRWDALPAAVSFGITTVRVERIANVDVCVPLPPESAFFRWEDQADSAAVPTNAPPVRATARFVEETTGRKDRKSTLSPDWTTLVEACYQHPTHAWADVTIRARTVDGAVEVKRSIVPLAGDGRVLETDFRTISAGAIPTEIKLPEGTVQIR